MPSESNEILYVWKKTFKDGVELLLTHSDSEEQSASVCFYDNGILW